ncbi:M20 peptidase aminoacylase family protein [Halalkalibacter alkalisediminis]|uniref:M20 peptidase aminoacylase family protein n=1 Tax=Halalkalibacter alkalisediminis TaxID=935616 RepID=A0ABV6NKM1_9BACI|nr:M20 peptidase aminoacylase family protein [Halalkalibacter alkalisediminis]
MKPIVKSLHVQLNDIFDHLHANPELSWKEKKTTAYLKQLLERHGVRVNTFSDCTGLIAEIGSGQPVIAVRADMDALSQEVNGVIQANHSCAHDAHMTIAVGVLLTLNNQNLPKGTIRFIFQPAEEVGNGALKLVEKQVVDDVDYLYGVHLRPIQELKGGQATPAIIHGAGLFFKGKIIGEDTHGARPHLGVNAIEVGSTIVEQLKGIYLDPQVPYSVKMTKFQAGGEHANIIPGSAVFSIDMRAQTNECLQQLRKKVENSIEAIEKLYDLEIQLQVLDYVPAAEVDKQAEAMMEAAILKVLGQENFVKPIVTSGGDDFHFYTIKRPHIKATMLGLGANLTPGLHHPHMTFDRETILTGVEILAHTVVNTLNVDN